jgi:integrase
VRTVDLIRKIKAKRGDVNPEERVFRVAAIYGSLQSAAVAIGIPRIAHHELRDLFATSAIESGVDIPTVADWLGHKDHGKLLLERYRKHRDEHAQQAAKKVLIAL